MKDIFICKCQEELGGCGHDFITNDHENLHCSSCGGENIDCSVKKAIIIDGLPEHIMEDKYSNMELEALIKESVDMVKQSYDLKQLLIGWFKEKNFEVPKKANLIVKTHFDYSEDGEKYLDEIIFSNASEILFEISDELKDIVTTNTTMECLMRNEEIILNKRS